MNNDKLQQLKRAAQTASPGPWRGDRIDGTVKYHLNDANGEPVISGDSGYNGFGIRGDNDEHYLLTAHPAAILDLIAMVDAGNPASVATPAAASAGAAGTIDTPKLAVWEGQLPESNGKTNYTAVLHRAGAEGFDRFEGMTIAQSEYPGRVRYEADCVRHLIGELAEKPCITDYDADEHSEYVERAATAPVSAAPAQQDDAERNLLRLHAHIMGFPEINMMAYEDAEVYALNDWAISLRRLVHTIMAEYDYKSDSAPASQSAGAPVSAAEPAKDVCAEMRALCSACGGTGDVTSIDGEWRGSCDCQAAAQTDENSPQTRMDAQSKPLFWLSSQQVYGLNAITGVYLPFQREPGGNFDFPVYVPDPAGEWVKRADLAMGQEGAMQLVLDMVNAWDVDWDRKEDYNAEMLRIEKAMRALAAAKQAGK